MTTKTPDMVAYLATGLMAAIRALPACDFSGYQPTGTTTHDYCDWCEQEGANAWAIAGLGHAFAEAHDFAAGNAATCAD